MNDTNLEKMTPKKYNRVPVEEFNDDDIEIIWRRMARSSIISL